MDWKEVKKLLEGLKREWECNKNHDENPEEGCGNYNGKRYIEQQISILKPLFKDYILVKKRKSRAARNVW